MYLVIGDSLFGKDSLEMLPDHGEKTEHINWYIKISWKNRFKGGDLNYLEIKPATRVFFYTKCLHSI